MVLPCRIACLRIPRFQIVAHQKAEPALKGKPLALLSGNGNRAQVLICSKEAALHRVYPGMKFSEARAVCADLLWREYDEQLYKKLQTQVLQRLVMASPQISSLDNGSFLLDASGLTHLGGENKFCRLVQKLVNTAGFPDMQIGVADTAFAAQVASKFKRSKHCIIPTGKDKEFLAALSVQHMPISADMQETLISLGIKTIGQLLQIPADELQERFGREGLLALDLADGVDKTQPQIVLAPEVYESSVDLNFPVESLDQTKFILKSMLERICSKLKENGLLAEELNISFFNDNDKFNERPLKLLRPSSNTKFLLELIKLSLEASPLLREYTGIHLEVSHTQKERWTQNKVRIVKPEISLVPTGPQKQPTTPSSTSFVVESNNNDAQAEPFALLLQRFITRLGTKSVVRPVANDQHIPELAASFQPLAEDTETVLPININFGNSDAGASALACGLILKRSSSPEPVMVEYQGKIPTSITYQGRWHKIKELTEPERLSGLWWEKPVRKSYYVALIEAFNECARNSRLSNEGRTLSDTLSCDSYLVLLVHDHDNNSWQLDGFFD